MIDTVIFDFDGTIMDTNKVIIESWQHTYRTLTGKEGEIEYILSTFGEQLEESLEKAFPDTPVKKSVDIYRSWHRENFGPMISIFPGVKELLEEVKRRGYKMGIATSRVAETLYQGLGKYNLEEYFDAVVTVEDVKRHKPAPDCILKTLEKLESNAENAVMIGDSMPDILCCKNAGVKSVLVSWSETLAGKKMEDFKREESPDYIINSPDELLNII